MECLINQPNKETVAKNYFLWLFMECNWIKYDRIFEFWFWTLAFKMTINGIFGTQKSLFPTSTTFPVPRTPRRFIFTISYAQSPSRCLPNNPSLIQCTFTHPAVFLNKVNYLSVYRLLHSSNACYLWTLCNITVLCGFLLRIHIQFVELSMHIIDIP